MRGFLPPEESFSGLFADHDGFEFKSEAEALLDVRADVFGDAQDIFARGAPEVHENEGVALVPPRG